MKPREAIANIASLQSLPHSRFLSQEKEFWDVYRGLTADLPVRGNQLPEAHLAAILRQHGVTTLCTYDRDFCKFGFLILRDPRE